MNNTVKSTHLGAVSSASDFDVGNEGNATSTDATFPFMNKMDTVDELEMQNVDLQNRNNKVSLDTGLEDNAVGKEIKLPPPVPDVNTAMNTAGMNEDDDSDWEEEYGEEVGNNDNTGGYMKSQGTKELFTVYEKITGKSAIINTTDYME